MLLLIIKRFSYKFIYNVVYKVVYKVFRYFYIYSYFISRLFLKYFFPARISLTSLYTCIWLSYRGFILLKQSTAVEYWRITKFARLYNTADLRHNSRKYGYSLLFFFMRNCLVRYIFFSFK